MNKIIAISLVCLAFIHVVFSGSACVKDEPSGSGRTCDLYPKVKDDQDGEEVCCPVDGEKIRYYSGTFLLGPYFTCTCQTDAECASGPYCDGLKDGE